MTLNGWELRYPMSDDGWCDLAKILDSAAANLVDMEELKDWYDQHKTPA